MTVCSFFVLFILILYFRKKRKVTEAFAFVSSFAISMETMTSIGYFIRIGELEISQSEFLILLDIVIALIYLNNNKCKYSSFKIGFLLIISSILSLLFQIIFPYQGNVVSDAAGWDRYYFWGVIPTKIVIGIGHIKEILHLICYVILFIVSIQLNDKEKTSIIKNTFFFEKFFIWYGVIELIFTDILHRPYILRKLLIRFIGDSYVSDDLNVSLGVANRLQGFKSEPSMYGMALFIFLLLTFYLIKSSEKENEKRKYYVYFLATLALMVFSLAFSSAINLIWFIACLVLYKCSVSNKGKKICILFLSFIFVNISILMLIYIYNHNFNNYYLKRIHMALINVQNLSINGWHGEGDFAIYDGSTRIRLISLKYTLKYFFRRPFFGLALGSTYSHSAFATVLASIGIVGASLWLKFTFFHEKIRYYAEYYFLIALWIVLLFISGVGLFQFYGIENILIVYLFNYFVNRCKEERYIKRYIIIHNTL